MPFQGNQNEKAGKYGGIRCDPRGLDHDVVGESTVGKHTRKQQRRNECENLEMAEKDMQDGEARSIPRSDPMTKIAQQMDDGIALGTMSERFDSSSIATDNADFVVQKVDEWLKHRSDSLSSIEFDNEIKTVEDYEFSRLDQDAEENYQTSTTLGESNQKASSCTPSLINFAVSGIVGNSKTSPLGVSLSQTKVHDIATSSLTGTAAGIYRNEDAGRFSKSKIPLQGVPDSLQISPLTNEDKSIMLMTPQELERMPDSGIEFEESVGPKEFETLAKQELMVQALHYSGIEKADKSCVFQDVNDVKCSILQGEMQDKSNIIQDSSEETTEALNVPALVSSTLATISISTDNDSNTTCIIINTKLGQREFKINTANLMQAAATLQPMTLADLVDQRGIPVTSVVEPGLALGATGGENSEIYHEISVENIDAEPLTSTSFEKVPIKGCKIKEKAADGTVCTHTGRCKKVWTCPEPSCGKVYTKQCKLKVHMMLHSGVRPYKCEVEGCDWAFTTLYKLKRHLETHCGAKDFVCDFEGCTRSFTTVYNLNSHKRMHVIPNRVACPIENCHEQFPTRRKMEMHMKEHREIDAPYKCTFGSCGKMYYTANSMASHMRVHQKTNFQCSFEGCNKVFEKLSRYKVHMWHHTGEKPYVCSFEGCNWAFSSASKLKRHMRKHTGERKYPCKEPGCNKSFMRLEHLQGHLVIHRGDKPFWCPHENCEARFTAKSSLYVHMKKHADSVEKIVYPCPIENCDKKYNCKSSLRIHMLRYHTPVLADAGQVDFVTLLSNEELQGASNVNNYEQVIEQQNPISVTAPDQCMLTTATLTSNDIVEVATMVIGELSSRETSPSVASSQLTTTEQSLPSCQSELETLSTLCVLQQNNSGSARTDFCSNHMLMDRVRKRRLLQQESQNVETASELDDQTSELAVPPLASDDAILTSTATSFHSATSIEMNFIQNQVLPDDPPPPHGDVYPEEGLLTSMANKLSVPISLLAEPSVRTSSSGQNHDFGNSQTTVTKFAGTTINLQDLE